MAPGREDAFPHEHVCMGGTFSPFHRGHQALIVRALTLGEHVFIGVTDGALAQGSRERRVPPVSERIKRVEAFVAGRGADGRVEVAPIMEPFGRALEERFTAIVVSTETAPTAARINEARGEEGLVPLVIEEVPFVLGLDGLPVNGTRVAEGEIDPDGVEPQRVHLAVGSDNPVKLEAARRAFGRWVPVVEVTGVAVDSGVPEQPYGEQGAIGARNRAEAALAAVDGAGLGVGIEAAIVEDGATGQRLDVQFCAIVDAHGVVTEGHGPGFTYPPRVFDDLDTGQTVGEAMGNLAADPAIGSGEGAIGYLTRSGITRAELTEWAVMMALVPRLRPELYQPLA